MLFATTILEHIGLAIVFGPMMFGVFLGQLWKLLGKTNSQGVVKQAAHSGVVRVLNRLMK